MAMGDSGGRSAGNRIGQGANRRATQRQRAYIDPPWDHEPIEVEAVHRPQYRLTSRGELLVAGLAWGLWTALCVFLAVVVCNWLGLL